MNEKDDTESKKLVLTKLFWANTWTPMQCRATRWYNLKDLTVVKCNLFALGLLSWLLRKAAFVDKREKFVQNSSKNMAYLSQLALFILRRRAKQRWASCFTLEKSRSCSVPCTGEGNDHGWLTQQKKTEVRRPSSVFREPVQLCASYHRKC